MKVNLIIETGTVEEAVSDMLEDSSIHPDLTKNRDGCSLDITDKLGHRIAFLATAQLLGTNVNDAENIAMYVWEDGGHMEGLTEPQARFEAAGNPHVEFLEGDIISDSVTHLSVLLSGQSGIVDNGTVTGVRYNQHFIVEVEYERDNAN